MRTETKETGFPIPKRQPSADLNEIPPMRHPLGSYWRQPHRTDVLTDDKVALMTASDADKLYEYSTSIPTGAYEGKMWKSNVLGKWYLHWYGHSNKPDHVSINTRELLTT